MTDKEILYISTIAKYRNITKASKELFIAQPSLTQALHRIENEYKTLFFYRLKGGLELTDAGKIYLAAADKMQQIYKTLETEINEISGMQQGRINVGTTVFYGGMLLPEIIPRFYEQFPNVRLNIYELSSAQLEEWTAEGKLDVSLIHRPFKDHDLNYFTLYKEEFLLAVSRDNPDYLRLSKADNLKPYITGEILAKQKFVMQMPNQRIRHIGESICTCANVSPEILLTTSSVDAALSLAGKGLGAAFVPESISRYYGKNNPAFFRFPYQWNSRWEFVVAFSKNMIISRPCLALLKVVQECISSMPEVFP